MTMAETHRPKPPAFMCGELGNHERAENIGYLFWGGVGTGKSYLAACIANALMEKEIAVRMTNFATIFNDLSASFEGRNEYISRLCSYPLLILDDFGMERGRNTAGTGLQRD